MKKYLYLIAVAVFGISFSAYAQPAQSKYVVQIAAYTEEVPQSHFGNLPKLYLDRDCNDIYRYVTGVYNDLESAETLQQRAQEKGFKYARVIDLAQYERRKDIPCGNYNPYANIPDARPLTKGALPTVRAIFFDFNKYDVRKDAAVELDILSEYLAQHSGYSVELHAHTDAKGSAKYNRWLSGRRWTYAKRYLMSKGIEGKRIEGIVHGEGTPIAINEANGVDSPQGRQFNRRVTFVVRDKLGNKIDVTEQIEIPDNLRVK